MKRSEIREFVRLGVVAIQQPSIEFHFGKYTDWNANRSNVYPCIFNPSLEVGTDYPVSAPLDEWPIILYIAYKDKIDSKPEEYEDLIDQADNVAQQLMYRYRQIITGYTKTQILKSSRESWIKQNADLASGVILRFAVINTDQTNVCP